MTNTKPQIKSENCCRCKKNKATLNYAESYLSCSHGFIEHICQECYEKIRNDNAWFQEGKLLGRNEVIEIIKKLENPYPTDIYPEINAEIFKEINKELQKKFKFPLDRLSAELMRRARNTLKEDLIKQIQDKND
jgi:hypothetical protein